MTEAKFDGVCELVLQSEDPEGMVTFYAGLGLGTLAREGDRVWLDAGGSCRIGIWTPGKKEHADRGGSHVHFALSVAPGRLDALADRFRDTDWEFEGPVEHDGGDRSIYLFDPAGNRLELWDYFQR
jgi:catechol-2,3-dioxygenase